MIYRDKNGELALLIDPGRVATCLSCGTNPVRLSVQRKPYGDWVLTHAVSGHDASVYMDRSRSNIARALRSWWHDHTEMLDWSGGNGLTEAEIEELKSFIYLLEV